MASPHWASSRQVPSLAVVLALAACSGPAPGPVLPPDDAGRPPNPSCLALPPPPSSGRIRLERAFESALSGTGARQLIQVVLPSATRAGFAALQSGAILAFEGAPGAPSRVVLDLADRLDRSVGESGLVSLALDPAFETNGHAYVVYTAPPAGAERYLGRVARFTWDGTRFDPESELVILDVPQADITHSVNHVAFGADGMLYVSLGDQRRTTVHAQDPSTLPGSVLRLDVSSARPGAPYVAPPDNPFAGGGAPEVYAIGLRNPWRFTVDPVDGTMLLGDVGQDSREEIDRVVAGGNYGWPDREGTACFQRDPCDDARFTDPVVELTHAEMRSVVAGYRWRRDEVPELEGRVLLADFVTGSVWSADPDDASREARLEIEGRFMITSFALDDEGVHHVVRYDPSGDEGGVYRVVAETAEPSDFPTLLSRTGCVDPGDPRELAPGMVRFSPAAELWSDGAEKARAIAIPDGTAIAVRADGDLDLPVGSVVLKHFGFEGRLHETRLLMRVEDGWTGYSYRWNEAQTDAELLPSATSVTLGNGVRWQYPSRSQCFHCHTSAAGGTLGLEAAQLDDAQLGALLEAGYFDRRLTTIEAIRGSARPALAHPFGAGATLDARARSYLHVNCSSCHRPDAPGRGNLDLRAEVPLGRTGLCNAEPLEGRLWGFDVWDEQRLLVPGRPEHSIVHMRMSVRGLFRMPPIATDVVHEGAVTLIGDWISAMERCDR